MGKGNLVARMIGFALDRVPYGLGRFALFVFSFGMLRSERWAPLGWLTELFTGPLWYNSREFVVVSRRGVRWTGYLFITLVFCTFTALVVRTILRM